MVDRMTGGVRGAGFVCGLSAAALFGASTPFAKRLLDDASPQLLAGLLYLGAFAALTAAIPLRRRAREARLRRSDAPRLAALVVAGGILAPVLMLAGLDRVSGATGSLLLNLEGPFTVLIAIAVFGEYLDRRAVLGAVVVFGGAAILSGAGGVGSIDLVGVLLIAAATALWGLDNNLTQGLTDRDPFSIVTVKAGAAAVVNLSIAVVIGASVPTVAAIAAALGLGAVSYGASVVLDAYALRALGAAREAVLFATAPFVGMVLSVPVLGERIDAAEWGAAIVMGLGIALLVAEGHSHVHGHDPLVHDHVHRHDDGHHDHDHPFGPYVGAHSHPHRHERVTHAHPHASDAHHRHDHPS